MNSMNLLDELELWIKRVRALPPELYRPVSEREAIDFRRSYGDYDAIIGPFAIKRLDRLHEPVLFDPAHSAS